jgi:hypothetical protein
MMQNFTRKLRLLLCGILVAASPGVHAQLSGTITVPSTAYPNLNTVITDLNTLGVGTGGLVVNITLGNPQTAPAGGYQLGSGILNASLSADKPLLINGNGNQINPATGTSLYDAFFCINGADYITIDSLKLTESSANATPTQQMEWGFALLKRNASAPFDGCQNITIRKCVIALNNSNDSTSAFYAGHRIFTGMMLDTIGVTTGDVHRNLTFSQNSVTSSVSGFYLDGINRPGFYNYNINIQNNQLLIGGNTATAYGVYLRYDSVSRVFGNTITSFTNHTGNQYGVYAAAGRGRLTVDANNITLKSTATVTKANYAVYNAAHTDLGATYSFSNNVMSGWDFSTVATATVFGQGGSSSNSFDSLIVRGNLMSNITVNAGTISMFTNYFSNTPNVFFQNNTIRNLTHNGTSGSLVLFYNYGSGAGLLNISNNKVVKVTTALNTSAIQAFNTTPGGQKQFVITDNRVDSITALGTSPVYGFYSVGNGGVNSIVSRDTVRNCTVSGSLYGIYSSLASPLVSQNQLYNLSTSTGTIYGFYNNEGAVTFERNNIYNLQVTGNTGTVYGAHFNVARDTTSIINNFISGIQVPLTYNGFTLYGLFLNGAAQYKVYHNTINLAAMSPSGTFGVTGIEYNAAVLGLDLRNNIINVNSPSLGGGYTAAVHRSAGIAGNVPANFLRSSNGNIYYVPNQANNFFYAEGAAASLVNTYNLTNDPGFSSSCSQYKAFIGAENNSAAENNLMGAGPAGIYQPSGSSLAASAGVPSSSTTDFNGASRTTAIDAGALQFGGTVSDAVGPNITINTPATQLYCAAAPVIKATITDISGVNTGSGTAPRLYFKKSTDNNAFGTYPADNAATFNGWKYAEGTASGSLFSFALNYSLLTSTVALGDSISWFIAAQDNAGTPHVSVSAPFATAYCPTAVNLGTSAGAMASTTAMNGYKIAATPAFTITTALTSDLCGGENIGLSITPSPDGMGIQWQQDNGTSTFTNISAATSAVYNSPSLNSSNAYKAVLQCGSTTAATTPAFVVNVSAPQLTGTTPQQHCGAGPVILAGTTNAGSAVAWYTQPTGGSLLYVGSPYTTAPISTTTTFYAAAQAGKTLRSTAKPTASTAAASSNTNNAGLIFDALNAFTLQSVAVYPIGTGTGSITVTVIDAASNTTHTATVSVTGTAAGVKTMIPLNFNIPAGTGYRLRLTARTGNVTGLLRESNLSAGVYYPYTIPDVVSISNATTPDLYWYFYDWRVETKCESARTPVTATITTNTPAYAVSPAQAACNNGIARLTVTSPMANYNQYTWSPVTNLYTDAAATVAYTGGSKDTVYFKSAAAGAHPVYAFANNTITDCSAIDTADVYVQPAAGTVSITPDTICVGGIARLLLNSTTPTAPNSLQWQSSPNGTTYTDIAGATTAAYGYPVTSSLYVKAKITNSIGGTCIEPVNQVNVITPQLTTTPAGSRCGPGAVTLTTTASPGSVIKWYATQTGGAPLATGPSYTTPVLTSTTTYYTSAAGGNGTFFLGKPNKSATATATNANSGIVFDAQVPFTLKSVNVYPVGTVTGTITVYLRNSLGQNLDTAVLTTSGSTAPGIKTNFPVNFEIPAQSGLSIVLGPQTAGFTMMADLSGATYPYMMPGIATITGSSGGGTSYYYFYDWEISYGCESTRVPAVATVNTPPALSFNPAQPEVCEGEPVSVKVNSANTGYTYSWTPGNMTGDSVSVSPTINTDYVVTATDNTSGPNAGCSIKDTVTVKVNPAPQPVITANGIQLSTGSFASYQWLLNNQPIAGATAQTYTPQQNGSYRVYVTNTTLCADTSAAEIVTSVGLNDPAAQTGIRIYPNPARDRVQITAPYAVSVSILAADGKEVLRSSQTGNLSIQRLNPGWYTIQVFNQEGLLLLSQKLVKLAD